MEIRHERHPLGEECYGARVQVEAGRATWQLSCATPVEGPPLWLVMLHGPGVELRCDGVLLDTRVVSDDTLTFACAFALEDARPEPGLEVTITAAGLTVHAGDAALLLRLPGAVAQGLWNLVAGLPALDGAASPAGWTIDLEATPGAAEPWH